MMTGLTRGLTDTALHRLASPLTAPRKPARADAPAPATAAAAYAPRRNPASLVAILALHGLLFYACYSGMMSKVVHAVAPRVVNVSFVAAPEPATPEPPQPKTVPVVQSMPTIVPPMPLLNIQQTEPTITVQQQQQPRNQEATAVAAAPAVAPPAPPAPAPASPRTISGVEYIRAPQPVYPAMAKRMGETGTVMLRVLIGEKGVPEQATVQKSSGSSRLDEAGRQAAMHALYKPYIEDGKAVPVYVLVPINFQLG
ncbi:energy transducer TonB [Oxalobacteraceae bacterium A2-2]